MGYEKIFLRTLSFSLVSQSRRHLACRHYPLCSCRLAVPIPEPSALLAGMSLLVPFNFSTAFAAYGGFLMLSNRSPWFTDLAAYVWAIVPPLTLILILGADWFMHKIGIPRTFVKILFNLIFLLLLTLLVNFALWQAWIPPEISI